MSADRTLEKLNTGLWWVDMDVALLDSWARFYVRVLPGSDRIALLGLKISRQSVLILQVLAVGTAVRRSEPLIHKNAGQYFKAYNVLIAIFLVILQMIYKKLLVLRNVLFIYLLLF